uniref:Uncharacterized protein n=1 Tax=Hyaloperonospora arabidopsidis (strain Emoy2) TaxID=559515 RepID=M4BF58_HYAAE
MKLAELPALEDVPPNERMRLFRQKLKLCCVLYDFTDMRKHVREKEVKRNALLQIVEYISASKVAWDPSVVAELLECVGVNIFRHLGRSLNASTINANGNVEVAPEDDEPMLEPSWPHMQLVYEILLRFVLSKEVDSRTAKDYFSKRFMIKLLNLFDSEDPRERDYLKYHQWFRSAAQAGAPKLPRARVDSASYGRKPGHVSSAIGLLHHAVCGERSSDLRTDYHWATEVLAGDCKRQRGLVCYFSAIRVNSF